MPTPSESGLRELTLVGAAAAMARGDLSSVELTEHQLRRIEQTEPAVHAYVTVTADRALQDARRADREHARGERRGPLHGVPIGVKDLFDTAGVRTTYGSARFVDHVPKRDAAAAAALRDAGTVLLGKHATHELAWGGRTDSAFFGPTHNPHRHGHIPGGSSGGSAASVVVGSSLGSIGSDTAGSVRIPAALSGCVGFKPTRGRIPLDGVMPLAPSLDHVGVLARTVADAAALTGVLTGRDVGREASPSPRVGWLGGWFDAVLDPGVRSVLSDTRQRLEGGLHIEDVPFADEPEMTEAVLTRILAEAGAFHRKAFQEHPELFGDDIAALMRLAAPTSEALARSEAVIGRFGAALHAALSSYDVLVCATVPITAPRIGELHVDLDGRSWPAELLLTRLTSPFNATGFPALSVPVGSADGLPVGLQVVGPAHRDDLVLDVARTVERVGQEQA